MQRLSHRLWGNETEGRLRWSGLEPGGLARYLGASRVSSWQLAEWQKEALPAFGKEAARLCQRELECMDQERFSAKLEPIVQHKRMYLEHCMKM